MKFNTFKAAIVLVVAVLPSLSGCAQAQNPTTLAKPLPPRQMENLGRGIVALKQNDGAIFVSWRMLGTDPDTIAFNVYRASGNTQPAKLNAAPLTGATNFVDKNANVRQANTYFVRPILNGNEGADSARFTLPANTEKSYLSLPLQTPQGYAPNDASVGDLNGDGEYEIVLHQTGRGKDNSQAGETDPPILQAYRLDGKLLWTINLGRNIREGAHYTQFMVYDLDGDGRAEIVCKTADGTSDGTGKIIGDAKANHLDKEGRILSGPEFLTVFDGLTGQAMTTTDYLPSRLPDDPKNLNPTSDQLKTVWGDGYGNRFDRFLACIAYLDGVHPSIVMCRGYYTRTFLVAYDFRGGKLSQRWTFDSQGKEGYAGQGNHSLSVGDVDGDGRDEIVYGKMAVDDDGTGLYTTRIGHGDAGHLSDLDPSRPGLEMFSIQEEFGDSGAHLFDARTGEVLWKKASISKDPNKGQGPGRGLALDIDPRYPGFESWAAGAGLEKKLWDVKGNQIGDNTPSVNFGIYWDGDPLRELLDSTRISKWDWEKGKAELMLDAKTFGCVSNNGTKATPTLSADILGDWREEVIFRTEDNRELRIFTTTIPTEIRLPTLMHDPIYRLSIAWQNVAYNQPPHTGFFLGDGMKTPPAPNIVVVKAPQKTQDAVTSPLQISDVMPATQRGPGPTRYEPPIPARIDLPTLWLIGDSTVRNGSKGDNGPDGQWGWGAPITAYFNPEKINVVNRALGGTSSRSFYTGSLWKDLKPLIKKGDWLIMQFGHNDGGKPEGVYPNGRASLRGTGDETREVETTPGTKEVVHTFGWYLKQFVKETRAQGATPIICSLTPRKRWSDDGKFGSFGSAVGHAEWAEQTAKETGVLFVPLYAIASQTYQKLGREKVERFFVPSPKESLHTGWDGAVVNAECVVTGLKSLPGSPFHEFFSARADAIEPWKENQAKP